MTAPAWLQTPAELRARLDALAARPVLWDAEVREAEGLAAALGVPVTLERLELATGERTRYTVGASDK